MAIATKKKPAAAKKKNASNASNVKSTKNVNGSFDIKKIDSEEMLFFVLQDIKTSINKLDDKIEKQGSEFRSSIEKQGSELRSSISKLDDKIDRNFLWTLGVVITGFIGLVAIILSKL